MYLNESDVKKAIEDVVLAHGKHAKDFKIYQVKRKTKTAKQVSVFFILRVKSDPENEVLYNDFMSASMAKDDMEILESELDEENKVLVERFLIKCDVSIYGV